MISLFIIIKALIVFNVLCVQFIYNWTDNMLYKQSIYFIHCLLELNVVIYYIEFVQYLLRHIKYIIIQLKCKYKIIIVSFCSPEFFLTKCDIKITTFLLKTNRL